MLISAVKVFRDRTGHRYKTQVPAMEDHADDDAAPRQLAS